MGHPFRGLVSFKQIAKSTNKGHQEDFLKAAVSNCSAKGARSDSF